MSNLWVKCALAAVSVAGGVATQAGWTIEGFSVPPNARPVVVSAYSPARQSLIVAAVGDGWCVLSEHRAGVWSTTPEIQIGVRITSCNPAERRVGGYWDTALGQFVLLGYDNGAGAIVRWSPGGSVSIVPLSYPPSFGGIAAAFYDEPSGLGIVVMSYGAVLQIHPNNQVTSIAPPVTPFIYGGIGSGFGGWVLRSSALDTARRRIVALVGFPQPTLWEYDLVASSWFQATVMPSGFLPRLGAALGYDPVRGVMVISGGWPLNATGQLAIAAPFADAWHYDGAQVYQAAVGSAPAGRWGGMFVWNDETQRLTLVAGTNDGSACSNLRDVWTYLPGQRGVDFATYGSGCPGSRGAPFLETLPNGLPFAGQPFSLLTKNVPLFAPVFMMVGASDQVWSGQPLPFSLAPFGAPSCMMLTGPDLVYPTTNVLGTAIWSVVLPSSIGGVTLFQQAVVFDPSANPAGLTVSNGGRALVGF